MTKLSNSIGAGLNPAFLDYSLPLPELNLIEFGISDLQAVTEIFGDTIKKSLHIARSPIAEIHEKQKKFIAHLSSIVKNSKLLSVGFHITGPRESGIGKYGFSSHYSDSPVQRNRVIDFIKLAQDVLQIPVWVENANFYSGSSAEIEKNFDALSAIADITDAGIILDLSHLYIDSWNVGANALQILNNLLWSRVCEIHLSGIREGSNGALHDAHNQSVPNKVWTLFQVIYESYIQKHECFITIEHTDITWKQKTECFYKDFSRLKEIMSFQCAPSQNNKAIAEMYASNYLHKILESRNIELKNYLTKNKFDFHQIIDEWINEIIKTNKYIMLNESDMLDDDQDAIPLQNSFHDFVREKIRCE